MCIRDRCVTSICQWLMNMVNNRITFQVVRDIRVQAFQHMEILPLSYICLLYTSRCV